MVANLTPTMEALEQEWRNGLSETQKLIYRSWTAERKYAFQSAGGTASWTAEKASMSDERRYLGNDERGLQKEKRNERTHE